MEGLSLFYGNKLSHSFTVLNNSIIYTSNYFFDAQQVLTILFYSHGSCSLICNSHSHKARVLIYKIVPSIYRKRPYLIVKGLLQTQICMDFFTTNKKLINSINNISCKFNLDILCCVFIYFRKYYF